MNQWEGSRQQTGCFAAVVIIASAGYSVRAVFRRLLFETDPQAAIRLRHAEPIFIAIAVALTVLAVGATSLHRWALTAYFIVALCGVTVAFAVYGGWHIATPLLIGMATVAFILYMRRDQL
jgi:hypothetical protein